METLVYVLIYFLRGRLPWFELGGTTRDKYNDLIKDKKLSTPTELLCRSLPSEFATYLNYSLSLGFAEEPDYWGLRKLFRDLFFREGFHLEGFQYEEAFTWRAQPAGKGIFTLNEEVASSAAAS